MAVVAAERAAAAAPSAGAGTAALRIDGLNASYGASRVVRDVTADIAPGRVTAIIGPSGCGKSTLLRCLNRLHETARGASVSGSVWLDGVDIYASGVSAVAVRRQVALVMQRPTPFPMLSIAENVVAGLRANGARSGAALRDAGEAALRRAALWNEVAHRLGDSPVTLSEGQQQRLCIARALAVSPRVLLLDEPTASLDPASVQRIEELVYELRERTTVVMVTHNMQQAARVSDTTAFVLHGELVEMAPTARLFTAPADARTEAYITGRFG
ncbi:MAG: phosphate ABC transporter ATP-binding protein [Gemmatimonadaceae bacterium]|nr:phosphate ABC transporter ATP-binding protein [Gemmatimonadaceae bacterium]